METLRTMRAASKQTCILIAVHGLNIKHVFLHHENGVGYHSDNINGKYITTIMA